MTSNSLSDREEWAQAVEHQIKMEIALGELAQKVQELNNELSRRGIQLLNKVRK